MVTPGSQPARLILRIIFEIFFSQVFHKGKTPWWYAPSRESLGQTDHFGNFSWWYAPSPDSLGQVDHFGKFSWWYAPSRETLGQSDHFGKFPCGYAPTLQPLARDHAVPVRFLLSRLDLYNTPEWEDLYVHV